MAIDLTMIAEHDILIERIAIRVNAKRGHWARYVNYLPLANGETQLATTRSGILTDVTFSFTLDQSYASVAIFDGDPASAQYTYLGIVGNGASLMSSISPDGRIFNQGMTVSLLTDNADGSNVSVWWKEHCTCQIGHDHPGRMNDNSSQGDS